MFEIIRAIIDHAWESSYQGDQQYIYYTCAALIIILSVAFIDMIKQLFSNFWRP